MKKSNEKEIICLLKSLISFKTTENNFPELNRCIDFVKNYFSGSNANVFIKKFVSNKKPSLVITTKNTKKPDVFFVAHLDVVPADVSDFEAKIKKGKLFGRGSLDNKGAASALMLLMKEAAKRKQKQKPSVGLVLTTDEEVGGEDGINYLLKQGFRSKFVVVPDGGKDLNWFIFKEKGLLHLKIFAKGKSTHGSRPWKGDNAIEKLIKSYMKIKKLFKETATKNHWHNTINLGKISGGKAVNVVPDYAEMLLDIRFVENNSIKDLLMKIKKEIKNIPGLKIEVLQSGDFFIASKKNDYLQKLAKTAESVTGKKIVFCMEHGASDIRHFAKYKIPGILFMPGGSNVHSKNEYVNIDSLIGFYEILRKFVGEL